MCKLNSSIMSDINWSIEPTSEFDEMEDQIESDAKEKRERVGNVGAFITFIKRLFD